MGSWQPANVQDTQNCSQVEALEQQLACALDNGGPEDAPEERKALLDVQRRVSELKHRQSTDEDYRSGLEQLLGCATERVAHMECEAELTRKEVQRIEQQLACVLDQAAKLDRECQAAEERSRAAGKRLQEAKRECNLLEHKRKTAMNQANENERLAEAVNSICIICLARPALRFENRYFVPCGHGSVCRTCATELRRRGQPCPECRQPIQSWLRVYTE